jgi:PASTA domain
MHRHRKRPLVSVVACLAVLCAIALDLVPQNVGADPSSATIKVHLSLTKHQVVAGQPIKGTVVLINTGAKERTVNTCAEDGWLAVGLSGDVNSYPFGSFEVKCAPSVRLAPGANRFPVTVLTTYVECTQPQPGDSSVTPDPICTVSDGHVGPPPLPAGRYSTKIHLVGLSGMTQTPNRVVVVLEAPAVPPTLAPCAVTSGTAPMMVMVPNVVGYSSSLAALALAKVCLNASYANPVGTSVISESPSAISKVPEHSTVTLTTR